MKNIVLSAVAVLAMSSFAVAGGDIAPVEEPVVVVEPVIEDSGFYLGLAYGAANVESTWTEYNAAGASATYPSEDFDYSTVMLQAGYKFNQYVAIEGRYWIGLDEDILVDETLNIDTFGIYVKPMYPVTDAFDIYALLGYASSDLTVEDAAGVTYDPNYDIDGFSWGIGAAYSFNDNVSIFVDYVNMYDDTEVAESYADGSYDEQELVLSTINFGVTYKF